MRTTLLTYARWQLLAYVLFFIQPAFCQVSQLPHKRNTNMGQMVINKFQSGKNSSASVDNTFQFDPEKRCLTMEADASLRKRTARIGTMDEFEKDLQKNIRIYKEKLRTARTQATVYTIPIIVHVVHNGEAVGTGANISAAQVQSQIDVLNEDFRRKAGTPGFNTNPVGADIEIEFALALRDPQGNTLPEPGIHRVNGNSSTWDSTDDIDTKLKVTTIWDTDKYLNIWTIPLGGDVKNLLGYAQFPIKAPIDGLDDPGMETAASSDGVVVNYKAFGRVGNIGADLTGRTATHEIGHWLGLRHIWGDDNGGCSKDDFCADTPQTADKHHGCATGSNTCTSPGMDMVENYMDYSDDACVNVFTNDQKTRMRTVLESCPRRKELLTSTVHIPTGTGNKPIADFIASQTIACDGSTIQFTDKSSTNTTAWSWEFFDGSGQTLATFTNKNQSITFTGAGNYGVRLIASNTLGQDTISLPNYITILSNTNLAFPFTESAEGDQNTAFPNWVPYNPDADRSWVFTDQASGFGDGIKSIAFDNYSGDDDDNPYGTIDAILSNKIDLSTNQYAELSFDVAYARYNAQLTDTLTLLYSTDCGKTFTAFWTKGGQKLATAPDTEEAFVPTEEQWRKETVSLGFLNGNSSVYIAIANSSGWGNNIYLDNIKVSVPAPTQKPIAAFTVTEQTVCTSTTVQFNDVSQNSPIEWTWSFQGGTPATSTKQHPSVTYTTPGTYAVTLTAKNALGTGTITQQAYITVTAKPAITVTANKTTICAGDEVELTANGATEYKWYDGTDLIGEGASIVVSPQKDATYIVVGITNSGCEGRASKTVTVNTAVTKPVISISAPADSATVTLTCESPADAYQWFKDGSAITGATAKTYNVKEAGSYTVKTTSGQCTVLSDAVVLTSSPEEIAAKNSLKAYPNPVSDELTIELPAERGTLKIAVYNALGMKVSEREANPYSTDGLIKLQVAQYPKGHYFIRISGEASQYTQSFIKQ